jgi:ubiquinone/menaquinone biosynthesis C-methylase UbiE
MTSSAAAGLAKRRNQRDFDAANAEFWNELCCTSFARQLGITDHSPPSLKKFDEAYLAFYPYLLKHVDLSRMSGMSVLEVGLGWGTLGQKIAEAGAEYVGLDIAPGPVMMMSHRLQMAGLAGHAIQGSMLQCPMETASLDFVVSIGCFHHTGDVQRCIAETHRVLKPGGRAFIMVYNRFSYVQWIKWPGTTFSALLHHTGLKRQAVAATASQRKSYDSNLQGEGAPETAFLSIRQLKAILSPFRSVKLTKENCAGLPFFLTRERLLPYLGKVAGRDIYIAAQK